MSLVNVVCCQVEVSTSGWSLVQREPIELGVSKKYDREATSGEAMIQNGVEAQQGGKKRQAILQRNENGIREDKKFPQIGKIWRLLISIIAAETNQRVYVLLLS